MKLKLLISQVRVLITVPPVIAVIAITAVTSFCVASESRESATWASNHPGQHENKHKRLLLTDYARLNKIKRLLAKPQHAQMSAYLLGQADAIAESPPLSVIQNDALAVSGNKQDYFSVGPYWWPDPKTADGLPWINKDGVVNRSVRGPNTDAKLFDALASRLHTLALAYYMSNDARYANAAEQQLNIWFLHKQSGMSPHLKFAQAVPGRTDGRGIGIIEVRKIPGILDAISLLDDALSSNTKENLDIWLSEFLGWLIESKNGQDEANMHNNHGTFYDVIVTSIALHLDMDDVAKEVLKRSKSRAIDQIQSSGAQPHELKRTKPFHYSVFNLYAFAALSKMAQLVDSPFLDIDGAESNQSAIRIKRAHDYLFENLSSSTIWPGPQEKHLPVDRLVDASVLLGQVYPDISFETSQISAFTKAQTRFAGCNFWMKADESMLATSNDSAQNIFHITRCNYVH